MKYYLLSEQDIYELFVVIENAIYDLKENIELHIDSKLVDKYDEED